MLSMHTYTDTQKQVRGSRSGPLRSDTAKVWKVLIIRGCGATATFAAAINSWVTFPISLTLTDIAYGSLFNRHTGPSGGLYTYTTSTRAQGYELHIFGAKTTKSVPNRFPLDIRAPSNSMFRYVNILKSPSFVHV